MTRWRSFLAVLGVAVVGVSGYFTFTDDGRILPEPRARNGRGRLGRGGDVLTIGGFTFNFAQAGGAGMGTVCAGTAITSAEGDHLEFRRLSSGWCTKTATSATSGIANGDLVLLTSNKPRVMVGNDPTGVLGLLMEPATTNVVTHPDDLTHGDWVPFGTGAAAAIATKNYCTAPDGTLTGSRLQLAATATVTESAIFEGITGESDGTFSKNSQSVYFRSNTVAASQTGLYNYDGLVWHAALCEYTNTGWTRCLNQNVTSNGYILFGNSSLKSGRSFDAADLCVWMPQSEPGLNATSPIAGSRAAEVAYFPFTDCVPTIGRELYCPNGAAPDYSYTPRNSPDHPYQRLSYTVVTPHSLIQAPVFAAWTEATVDSQNVGSAEVNTGKFICDWNFHLDGSQPVTSAAAIAVDSVVALSCEYSAAGRTICNGASCATTAGAINITLQEAPALSIGGNGFAYNGNQDGGTCPAQAGNCGGFGTGSDAVGGVIKKMSFSVTR